MRNLIITLNKPVRKSILISGIEFKGICFISPDSLYPILHKGVELDTLPVETQELFKLCVKAEWNEIEYDQTIRFEYTKVELDLFKSYYKGLDKNVIKTILTKMGFDEYSINDLNRIVELENPNNDDIKNFTSLVSLVIGRREHFRFNTDDGSQSRLSLDVDNLREELEYYFEGCSISEVDQISFHLIEKYNFNLIMQDETLSDENIKLISEYYFNIRLLTLKDIKKDIELSKKIEIKLEENYKKWLALPVSTKEELDKKVYIAIAMYCDSLLYNECLDDYETAHDGYAKECAKIVGVELNDDNLYGTSLYDVHSELFNGAELDRGIKLNDLLLDRSSDKIMELFMNSLK